MYSVMDEDDGDEARVRFEAMWRAHHPAVVAYLRRRAPGEVADELAAEAFAVAWRRLGAVPGEARPWLIGTARRLLANRRRGERRAAALARRLLAQAPVVAPDPADLVGGDRGLQDAFAALPARDREVIALVAWDGLTPREVAAVLGIPAPMASSRIHRARARLRRALEATPATARERA
jgi:RNA polymerase sigma-70 factor (ECF subfamily)